jgi:UDP-glucose 4-epimerase
MITRVDRGDDVTASLILVTGARGAIGRHVVRLAKERGHVVIGLGHGQWIADHELPPIDGWLNGDISPENIAALSRGHGTPDAVIHLAGGAHVGNSIDQPAEDFQRTVLSAQRLLEWLRVTSPKTKIVIASSAAVYGIGHDAHIKETATCVPVSPYGTHKAMMEVMAQGYAAQFGLNAVILRLFSVYGPGLRKQLIWEVTNRLMQDQREIVLGGTGDERRDFVAISDAAAMLIDAVDLASPEAPTFNCCSGTATTVRQATDMLLSHFSKAKVSFSGKMRVGDPTSLVGDKALSIEAGLTSNVAFVDGLLHTMNWIKAVRLNGASH